MRASRGRRASQESGKFVAAFACRRHRGDHEQQKQALAVRDREIERPSRHQDHRQHATELVIAHQLACQQEQRAQREEIRKQ